MECCDRLWWARSIRGATTPLSGGHDLHDPRPPALGVVSCRRPTRASRRRRVEGADVVVAQRVEDEFELLAGRRRPRRCCGPAGRRPGPGAAPARVCGPSVCTDSTAAQRTSREPCLVIRPRCTCGVGLVVLGGQPGPAGQLLGAGGTGARRRSRRRTPPPGPGRPRGWLCTATIAGVACQPAADQPGEQRRSRSPGRRSAAAARRSAAAIRRGQLAAGPAARCPATPNRSLIGTWMPALGQHRVDLALQLRAQPDQLGPVPHQLAQLPGRRRGDPRLRQPTHPQQIGQIGGVPLVVLHPPVRERLDPQRMRQMHLRAQLGCSASTAQYQP